ncbi:MAG: DNA-formamidopyrimidine glycosylase family protein [Paenibacillaceae bacterium]
MPEWPEMEHYRKMLEVRILNKRITGVRIERERSLNMSTNEFTNRILNQPIISINRRAKMLLFTLESKEVMLLHLMLGGWMFYGLEQEKPERTIQVQLSFGEQQLYFIGLRLGYLHLFTPTQLVERLSDIGLEPFDPAMSLAAFKLFVKRGRGTLKKHLTDQSMIAGIGNCYSDEICYAAGVLPSRIPSSLTDEECSNLYNSMHTTLIEALKLGGYMDHGFYSGDSLTGQYNDRCKVYDREGEPCTRCGQIIVRNDVSNKKSFCCPRCQR